MHKNESRFRRAPARRIRALFTRKRMTAGALALSAIITASCALRLMETRQQLVSLASVEATHRVQLERSERIRDLAVEQLGELAVRLAQAERARDLALEELDALTRQVERERQNHTDQPDTYEAALDWTYIGKCVITAYCPCEECCGQWANGLTASGIPVGPGIVAVDPDVIPLGSTVVIDGLSYLAADIGGAIHGLRIDICVDDHATALALGTSTADVWVVA